MPEHWNKDDEHDESLSEEISSRWDPERLLRHVSRRAGRGEKLDATTRERYEKKLGVDLASVRIYSGEFAQQVTQAHDAEAVTVGNTGMILMGSSPDRSSATTAGRALLAHELTHVAQAKRGLHRSPLTHLGNAPLATEEHEREAEAAEANVYAQSRSVTAEPPSEKEIHDAVRRRVLELLEEDERSFEMRNGPRTVRS